MLLKKYNRPLDRGCRSPFFHRLDGLGASGHLSDEFVSLATLGLKRLARRFSRSLPSPLPSLPPFEEIVPRLIIPDVALTDLFEGDEFPDAAGDADLFDYPDALVGNAARKCDGLKWGSGVLAG